jgi:hypothetical protein
LSDAIADTKSSTQPAAPTQYNPAVVPFAATATNGNGHSRLQKSGDLVQIVD